jgi:Putative peptidoglycan binding domain
MATTLQSGAHGELVKRLQSALIGFGYDLGLAGADGSFGDRTRLAVASFQDAHGLPATGVADPETIAAMDLDPNTLEDLIEMDAGPPTAADPAMALLATVDGDDVYLDPPVRLWPQYDSRWKHARIAGPKTGRLLDWVANGCNASAAAMILRWFAEDCTAGSISFPTKPGGTVDSSWYGLRMGEAFWPNADPPGKVELTPEGRIHFRKLYSVAAHYLKTGEIQRNERGDVVDPSGPRAHYVTRAPAGGWIDLIRTMLEVGPVIVGIGAPAGHFVVAHGIMAGGLLVADPGAVLYQAHHGGTPEIENWKGKEGYLDGTMDSERVRTPSPSQWPDGHAPGQELDRRSYHLISGQYLSDMLDRLISVTSLTYPEGAKLGNSNA